MPEQSLFLSFLLSLLSTQIKSWATSKRMLFNIFLPDFHVFYLYGALVADILISQELQNTRLDIMLIFVACFHQIWQGKYGLCIYNELVLHVGFGKMLLIYNLFFFWNIQSDVDKKNTSAFQLFSKFYQFIYPFRKFHPKNISKFANSIP